MGRNSRDNGGRNGGQNAAKPAEATPLNAQSPVDGGDASRQILIRNTDEACLQHALAQDFLRRKMPDGAG